MPGVLEPCPDPVLIPYPTVVLDGNRIVQSITLPSANVSSVCQSEVVTATLKNSVGCSFNDTLCAGLCADLSLDAKNCGACVRGCTRPHPCRCQFAFGPAVWVRVLKAEHAFEVSVFERTNLADIVLCARLPSTSLTATTPVSCPLTCHNWKHPGVFCS